MFDGMDPYYVVAAIVIGCAFLGAGLTENRNLLFAGIGIAAFAAYAGGFI